MPTEQNIHGALRLQRVVSRPVIHVIGGGGGLNMPKWLPVLIFVVFVEGSFLCCIVYPKTLLELLRRLEYQVVIEALLVLAGVRILLWGLP